MDMTLTGRFAHARELLWKQGYSCQATVNKATSMDDGVEDFGQLFTRDRDQSFYWLNYKTVEKHIETLKGH